MKVFKASDIRGNYPEDLDPGFAFKLGQALVREFGCRNAVLGHDCRLSSSPLAKGLASGLAAEDCEVSTLGLCCTEEIYFAAQTGNYELGVMITGSHNPASENGFKIVLAGAMPVGANSGLKNIEARVGSLLESQASIEEIEPELDEAARRDYCRWLVAYGAAGAGIGKSLKIVADCGNGSAGLLLRELQTFLPHEIVLLNENPDGNFPNGVPNPLLPEKRARTGQAVVEHSPDFGIAFDGDADRCFFYDHHGRFIESYYLVGLLARRILELHPGEKIIHDPRLYWNTRKIVESMGGIPVMSKAGHASIKEKMRAENAIYGGEMSGHHYFRDFGYCDSGMLPWLLVASLLSETGLALADLIDESARKFPCSGEINLRLQNPEASIGRVKELYDIMALAVEELDGLNMEFENWRFNLRQSTTEPLARLNVESKNSPGLAARKSREILDILENK